MATCELYTTTSNKQLYKVVRYHLTTVVNTAEKQIAAIVSIEALTELE
jgi:hypothetical protein